MASQAAAALLLLASLHVLSEVHGVCDNVTQLTTRIETLLAEYDREAPPAGLVHVELSLYLRHASVNEHDAAVRIIADLKMSWQDDRVTWDKAEWSCDSVVSSAERLWLPDVSAQNAVASDDDDAPLQARLDHTGAITWVSRLDISVPISIQLEDWPRDIQTGVFKFSSRQHTVKEMELTITNVKSLTIQEVGAWDVMSVKSHTSALGEETARRRVAAWSVSLRRRAPALAQATGAVLLAAALLLLAAALLPPASRTPLCCCSCFISALWLVAAAGRLPGAGGAPVAVRVAAGLCACGGAACACAALCGRVARAKAQVPNLLRALLAAASTLCSLAPADIISVMGMDQVCLHRFSRFRSYRRLKTDVETESGAWAAAAQLLDRVLTAALVLAVLVLLAVYL